ncbi:hypothetical protein [Streptacidiphilus sp. MAP5-3]|uniref:hypothetical protein n=1 Tax=unclassified Streptacidiphilus TaxID=2643834 RepID=UPI003517AA9F
MSDMLTTVVTAAVTAVIVAPVTAFTVGPRLEARNRTIQAAFQAREECGRELLAMLSYCALLQTTIIQKRCLSHG